MISQINVYETDVVICLSDSKGIPFDRIATSTRAKATFILPEEDVEVKVGQVFRRLEGPVLTSPSLLAMGGGTPRISEIYPD